MKNRIGQAQLIEEGYETLGGSGREKGHSGAGIRSTVVGAYSSTGGHGQLVRVSRIPPANTCIMNTEGQCLLRPGVGNTGLFLSFYVHWSTIIA